MNHLLGYSLSTTASVMSPRTLLQQHPCSWLKIRGQAWIQVVLNFIWFCRKYKWRVKWGQEIYFHLSNRDLKKMRLGTTGFYRWQTVTVLLASAYWLISLSEQVTKPDCLSIWVYWWFTKRQTHYPHSSATFIHSMLIRLQHWNQKAISKHT